MKLSVSLPTVDVEFLDSYAHQRGELSRSAVLQRAVRLLRATELQDDYREAWTEWDESHDSVDWEATADDGLRTR